MVGEVGRGGGLFARVGSPQQQAGSATLLSAASLSGQGALQAVPGGVLSGAGRERRAPAAPRTGTVSQLCDRLLSPPTWG